MRDDIDFAALSLAMSSPLMLPSGSDTDGGGEVQSVTAQHRNQFRTSDRRAKKAKESADWISISPPIHSPLGANLAAAVESVCVRTLSWVRAFRSVTSTSTRITTTSTGTPSRTTASPLQRVTWTSCTLLSGKFAKCDVESM